MSKGPDEEVRRAALNALLALDRMRSKYPKATGLQSYVPCPTDVIIATNPKSGTTLLQHLLYQIVVAAGGGPDFDPDGTRFEDINDVAPWVDYGPQIGTLTCESTPRLFKTHSPAYKFDLSIGRFVFCVRDPSRFVGSLLDFNFDHATGGTVTDIAVREHVFHLYVRCELLGMRHPPDVKAFEHVRPFSAHFFDVWRSWMQPRRDNVLLLFYEDVVSDMPRATRELAAFVGVSLSEEDVARVTSRCTREAMLNDPRFECRAEARAFSMMYGAKKVQAADRNGFNRFSLDEEEQAVLATLLEEHTGYRTYAAWVAAERSNKRESILERKKHV